MGNNRGVVGIVRHRYRTQCFSQGANLVKFYQNRIQKNFIEKAVKDIENKFNKKKVVTLIWQFEKFYPAEDYHQDYYQNNFLRYLAYKSGCQREERLNKIWN